MFKIFVVHLHLFMNATLDIACTWLYATNWFIPFVIWHNMGYHGGRPTTVQA